MKEVPRLTVTTRAEDRGGEAGVAPVEQADEQDRAGDGQMRPMTAKAVTPSAALRLPALRPRGGGGQPTSTRPSRRSKAPPAAKVAEIGAWRG